MITINITPGSKTNSITYSKTTDTFRGSEKDIKFDTEYEVKNIETGNSERFKFTHSTGPEFDPKTEWVYKSESGRQLIIGNDTETTKLNAANYLKAKTR